MNARRRGLLATAAVGAVAAGLAAGPLLLPTPAPAAGGVPLPVPASSPVLVCPGPQTLAVPAGGEAAGPGGPVLVTSVAGPPAAAAGAGTAAGVGAPAGDVAGVDLLGAPSSRARSAAGRAPDATVGDRLGLRPPTGGSGAPAVATLAATALGPAVVRAATGAEAGAVPLAAVQSTLARSGELRSLTASTCAAADSESWLLGGSTRPGERLRLLLANAGRAPAVVDVEVRGPAGRVATASGDAVAVPAGGQVPVYVDALAPDLDRVAVHVTARSGLVRATLHSWRTDGLDPGGADDVTPSARPSRQQLVPGVSLVDGFGRTAGDPTAPGSTAIRIAVPGPEDAVVRLRLLDSAGEVELPEGEVVTVPAGGVVDVPVARVASGTYAAVVDADVPVVAAALVGRGPEAGTAPAAEFAWAASARPLTGSGYVALPPGVRSTLSLVAPGRTGRLWVTAVDAAGDAAPGQRVEVPAGASATVRLDPGVVAVRIDRVSGGAVAGALVCWTPDARGSLISVPAVVLAAPPRPPRTAVADPTLGLG